MQASCAYCSDGSLADKMEPPEQRATDTTDGAGSEEEEESIVQVAEARTALSRAVVDAKSEASSLGEAVNARREVWRQAHGGAHAEGVERLEWMYNTGLATPAHWVHSEPQSSAPRPGRRGEPRGAAGDYGQVRGSYGGGVCRTASWHVPGVRPQVPALQAMVPAGRGLLDRLLRQPPRPARRRVRERRARLPAPQLRRVQERGGGRTICGD